MLTTSRTDLPLTPAMKIRLDSPSGEHDVLQSEVFLEIENREGQSVVTQRMIKGSRDPNLITVHHGPLLTSPGSAAVSDEFAVNLPGTATRAFGFHRFLAKFLGWDLPIVPTFDGHEYPLYMQCIFPYFVVEQTRGWATAQPPLPAHFRIRDVHKRSVEFLLNLEAHQIALRRQELQLEKQQVETNWTGRVEQATNIADAAGGISQGLSKQPLSAWPPKIPVALVVPKDGAWIPLSQRADALRAELRRLVEEEIPRVQDVAEAARTELLGAEEQTRDRQTLLSRLLDALESEQGEVTRLERRLANINEDIQRNRDVQTLKRLGSRKESLVDAGICPICHQSIQDSLLPFEAEQSVMTLDENIQFLVEQRRTFEVVLRNAQYVAQARAGQVRTLNQELNSSRNRVRDLRQTLLSDGRLPSAAAIRSRLEVENSLQRDEKQLEHFNAVIERFAPLSAQWKTIQEELKRLPKEDVTPSDRVKIGRWTESLRSQLAQYGFSSFPISQVVVSVDTYRPEHDGFDLETNFALQSNISASDLIRTIWSYLHGLLELSRSEVTNHPGCIIFDEPRQQSTADLSFGELLKRASIADASNQQVIFFTSEEIGRLRNQLLDVRHTLIPIEGRVLKKKAST